MQPKLITFDCAQTLLWTDWQPHTFIARCAGFAEIPLPPGAADPYLRLFTERHDEYWAANRQGDIHQWAKYWESLGRDWLTEIGLDPDLYHQIAEVAEDELFSQQSHTFHAFDDVEPCLKRLKEAGYRLAVLSNWDASLDKCLTAFGIRDYFDAVYASLVHGVEKPDPEFFQIALKDFSVHPSEAVHVGNDPHDDEAGAHAAGMRAILIDRSELADHEPTINTLDHLESAFQWKG